MLAIATILLLLAPSAAIAARSATDGELAAFLSALAAAGSKNECEDGTPVGTQHLQGLVSEIDPNWASAGRSNAGASECGLGAGKDLFHNVGGTWTWVTKVGGVNYCGAVAPSLPRNVAKDLAFCITPPAGVVLGNGAFAPNGQGWGEFMPSTVFNGGDPTGLATHIRWRHWGHRLATGKGVTSIYKPGGGYYRRKGRIDLRASRIGICEAGGPRAYRRLMVRIPARPGGPLGKWFLWSGARDLCQSRFS